MSSEQLSHKKYNPRSERLLKKKGPLLIENSKNILILKGHKTSQIIQDVLQNISMLAKPYCKIFSRNNDILPFEDINSLEFLCQKNDCSLFLFGSHTKKRPNNLIFVIYNSFLIYDSFIFII